MGVYGGIWGYMGVYGGIWGYMGVYGGILGFRVLGVWGGHLRKKAYQGQVLVPGSCIERTNITQPVFLDCESQLFRLLIIAILLYNPL